jgi:dienelactone hydrolase
MKNTAYIFSFILLLVNGCLAQNAANNPPAPPEIIKIEAQPEKGFAYPYYLHVPPAMRESKARKKTHSILVIPNNSGKINNDLSFHEADAKRKMTQNAMIAAQLGTAVLMPVFPRPETDWKIYTHTLDRDSMLTDKKEFRRFDLHLVAMIDDARERLKKENLKIDKRVLITGYSASGMFANRFVFLHPKRVKAAAIGSPGGWAIAPAAAYKEKTLRYPLGTNDFETVSGKSFDQKTLRKVPLFIFTGDQDDNDSLVFRDGYETEDEKLVFELFGKTPVERWEISKSLYKENNLNAEFKLYPNVKHTVTKEMLGDILAFFSKHIAVK